MAADNCIFIVCGFPRSGTSMMMQCLEAGGIPVVFTKKRDWDIRNNSKMIPGYDPNPNGFYEIADLGQHRVWRQWRGKAIKVLQDSINLMPKEESYMVVYMCRNPKEIKRSMLGTMSAMPGPTEFDYLNDYENIVSNDIAGLSKRSDVTRLNYADVIENPQREMAKLSHWGIDVSKAAMVVDPKLYRHREATSWQ